jgi:integrase
VLPDGAGAVVNPAVVVLDAMRPNLDVVPEFAFFALEAAVVIGLPLIAGQCAAGQRNLRCGGVVVSASYLVLVASALRDQFTYSSCRTRAHYQAILEQHLLEVFGNRQLGAIKPKDVREWYEATLVDRPTLRSHAYSLLRTIMASAVNEELIDANPARIVGAGRAKRVHRIRPASVAELGVLTEAMPERLRLMVTLASWCALRFGETVELRRGDIDLGQEVIRIRRAAVRTRGVYSITTPKSDAGVRDVAIPPHIVPAIEALLAKYVGTGRDSLIFPADSGGHLQPSTLYRHWYKARDVAGRPDLRFDDLRHSGAVLAAATGATLAELMVRLGHSTPTAAMRYQHAAAGRDREIAALLSKLAD